MRVEISLDKTIEANASEYYDKIKKLKKKLEGTTETLENYRIKLNKAKKEKDKLIQELKKEKKPELKKEWYEKFRWFLSSEDFLVIGGRDATSNEIVIKKHASKNDLIFHTDMVGSPFFVIQADNKKVGDTTIKEAADATVTFSKAFKLNRTTTATFMAKPEQLTKEAPSGEYVPKGGFITKGKLDYVDNRINLAIGNYNGKVMAGPVSAIKKHCKDYVELEQGKEKPGAIAKLIKHKIGCEIDDITRSLPAGTFRVKK